MNCELCGYTDGKFYRAEIEGSMLVVCSGCALFGKIICEVEDTHKVDRKPQKSYGFIERSLKLDYPKTIKQAVAEKQLTIEKLAETIKESPYELKKIFNGKIIPADEIVRKLESALGISLYEDVIGTFEPSSTDNEISFEDIAQIKRKKQG
jgi:uncharacterized protein (TIGR00270 family)